MCYGFIVGFTVPIVTSMKFNPDLSSTKKKKAVR